MAGTSINGVGSGYDIDSIVTALVNAQKAPKSNQIATQKTATNTTLSGIGSLQSALDTFQTAMGKLNDANSFAGLAVKSSNTDALTATLGTGAAAGTYAIDVESLATSSKVATQYIDKSATFGAGKLTITQGSSTYNVTVKAGASLSDIRDSINTQLKDQGLTANIITDASGPRLVLGSSVTGAGSDISVSTSGDSSLDVLKIDGAGTKASATAGGYVSAPAANAKYTIDGLEMSSSVNKISSAISGVELNLVATGKSTVTVDTNTDGLKTSIQSFVSAYNALITSVNSLTKVTNTTDSSGNPTTTAASLASDSMTRNLLNTLRTQLVGSSADGGSIKLLSQLGISTKTDGTLEVDDTKLDKALEKNFASVQGFFTGDGGLLNRMSSSMDVYTKSNGLLDQRKAALNDTLSDLADQSTKLDNRMTKLTETLMAKYTAMDTLVAQLNATKSSVLTTLNALNKTSSSDS
ncbi:flagellar filament capping protein FliD [Pseudomonas nicosulfuronedens]|uniref:Flagellar hook-associated protein 2 n=1 Tax=Pseudomonas nicosulfuronedens TaxID=2571105 RepID=A0A5R9RRS9_9PSED|nr:flagellar filament capping protein FliD [Pseudomonas nicosulfuronedens]MDH1010610.1 flagellar filament capping protein FliD [Pseudomonas nicosulfuronedens]MDH1979704.1 flagellar filament capping protein FliD [Pseudomonas nicosulfuronedens]MDH2028139.1 flagellar filament capping protein FliD [Pseudomonas nicosulfuronedens]TLX80241.1 flagellar cap protein FliD [Pseudomonas nicosulfuronedens]